MAYNAGMVFCTGNPYPMPLGISPPVVQYGTFSMASTSASTVSASSTIIASSSGFHAVLLSLIASASVSNGTGAFFLSDVTSTQSTFSSTWSSTSLTTFPYTPVGIFASVLNEGIALNCRSGAITGLCTYIYI